MKISAIPSFRAYFSDTDKNYLKKVKKQALDSRRYAEYQSATRVLSYNFPKGEIKKVPSEKYPEIDRFVFTPNDPLHLVFKREDEDTPELNSYLKLASMVRKIAF